MSRAVVLSALVGVLLLECSLAVFTHRDEAELREALASGGALEQVEALFVLTNRSAPEIPAPELVRRILSSGDERLREWTMTTNFARFAAPRAQRAYARDLGPTPHAFRCQFLLNHRVGRRRNITLSSLERFLEGTHDDEP